MSENRRFIALQDKKILGIFNTREEAHKECLNEIERDKFWLIFKKRILKRLLKNHEPLHWLGGLYAVAEIVEVVEDHSV